MADDARTAAMPASWTLLQWPGNPGVRGLLTTREGGCSVGAYGTAYGGGGMNLGAHVGDQAFAVQRNRRWLVEWLGGVEPVWMDQVHGSDVVDLDDWPMGETPRADAAVLTRRGVAAGVLAADCLPVLLAAPQARGAAAAHAGWRGLAGGVLEHAVAALAARSGCAASQLQAWLGPAIGPGRFEIGADVRDALLELDPRAERALAAGDVAGKWKADLFELARMRLMAAGLSRASILGTGICTVSNPELYYSYRRDRVTGRHAALVWLA